jgi:hypothetical protein
VDRLRATIPAPRLAPYVRVCRGTDVDPITLYRWASDVALAVFDDVGTVEVAVRSAMAHQLARVYGLRWYEDASLLDDDTLKLVRQAFSQGRLATLAVPDDVLHGKLVATLMFGFWIKLLGRGGFQGAGDQRARRFYDEQLWKPALRHAFPNVGALERQRVEKAARRVQFLRNRVAHHEHIIWGVPLIGERSADGVPVRAALSDVHRTLKDLAGYVDADLQGWLDDHSRVPATLASCPLPGHIGLLI